MSGKVWLTIGAAALGLFVVTNACAQSVAVKGLSGEAVQLSATDLAAMPHQPVTLKLEGKSEPCEGVPLSQILAKVGAPQGKALRGPEMADVVEVVGSDGYRVALALAETDPVMRGDKVFLADRCFGAPLTPPEGPFRLIVLGDGRPARSARQVVSITALRLPAAP